MFRSRLDPVVILVRLAAILAATTAVGQPDVPPPANPVTILVTADTEGHVKPCESCPMHVGDGGLERRATAVAQLRAGGRTTLLLDAGAWLAGPESTSSAGGVMVTAYNALSYDVVHMTPADLVWGRSAVLKSLDPARFSRVSATLLDADGRPIFEPYTVKKVAGLRIAVIGVSEPPKGLEFSPSLREQFEGIRFATPGDALAEWLPKAVAESDRVVVLYDGSVPGLAGIRRAAAGRDVLIAVAGIRPERLPAEAKNTTLATEEHGKSVGVADLAAGKWTLSQTRVPGALPADPTMRSLLAAYAPRALVTATQVAAASPQPKPDTRPGSPEPVAMPGPPAQSLPLATQPTSAPATRPVAPPAVPPVTAERPARVPAKQQREPRGLAGVGIKPEEVDTAIRKGADFLWAHLRREIGEKRIIGGEGGTYEGYHTIAALALVKAGVHQRDAEFNAAVRAYLDRSSPEAMGTYASGVLCMLVEAYGDPRYEPKLRAAARYLLESLTTRGWDYHPKIAPDRLVDPRTRKALQVWGGRPPIGSGANSVERWSRAATQPTAELDHDNSLVQFAVLGLHAAARHGVEVPRETWQQVAQMMRERQGEAGGWGYVGPTSAPTGSMTCASTYALTVARYHLGEKSPAEDVAIERGLGWLAPQFAAAKNPGGGSANLYYYLYSVERLGRTLETEFIGEHEWYPMGAKYLLSVQQENGSWHDETAENRVDLTTSFAILFLSRSTPKLSTAAEPKLGPGMLKTGLLQPPAPRLYVVLDCSGSMMAEMNGQTKFDIARRSISTLLGELPDATQVALRVYGHRKTAVDPGANDDTELLVPMGALDRQGFANTLHRLRARGRTPMARSLQSAVTDLDVIGEKNVEVLLLTDGGEDSQPRLDPVAAAAGVSRTRGAVLNVVGFDIGRDDWGRQLREMAAAGNGRYWAAGDDAGLLSELRAAVLRSPGVYQVLTADGKLAHKGMFGDSVQLEPGTYTFQTSFAGRRFEESFWVNAGEPTAVLFDAGKFEVAAPTTAPASPDINPPVSPPPVAVTPATAPANRPKFCVHCGNRLTATGKFCTNCGKKIGE